MTSPQQLVEQIARVCSRLDDDVPLMEVCGTHTVSFHRAGLHALLPPNLRLVSGPGCPVCVTAQGYIDAVVGLARRSDVVIATYGDMVRVPGRGGSLEQARSAGADVRVVYSAREALRLAQANPGRQIVFVAVGFETTAPATAAVLLEARRRSVRNFSVLAAHKLVVPAMLALLEVGDVPLRGFLCPGHVSVIIGWRAYEQVAARYGRPCVVAGFEPPQMLQGLLRLVEQLACGEARVENVYRVAVTEQGNTVAQELLRRVFAEADVVWRGMGVIPRSGLVLREEFADFDAFRRFDIAEQEDGDPPGCRCGEVIQGKILPPDCPLFGRGCTPARPIGPCMVSSEGTCAAWFRYRQDRRSAYPVSPVAG